MADCTEDSEDATSSVGDEERVKRLFQACDGDGDGFIDRYKQLVSVSDDIGINLIYGFLVLAMIC